MAADPITVTLLVTRELERMGVPYLIGGSLASAVHGVFRATADADLVADLRLEHARPLAQSLAEAFYVDEASIIEAIRRHRSFNVIHLDTMFKVDVFVSQARPFDRSQFERRVQHVVATNPERVGYFASAEDTVLAKLEWYRMGDEVSERQWRDALGVLQVQGERLDLGYLRRWAGELHVADLLERALAESR